MAIPEPGTEDLVMSRGLTREQATLAHGPCQPLPAEAIALLRQAAGTPRVVAPQATYPAAGAAEATSAAVVVEVAATLVAAVERRRAAEAITNFN